MFPPTKQYITFGHALLLTLLKFESNSYTKLRAKLLKRNEQGKLFTREQINVIFICKNVIKKKTVFLIVNLDFFYDIAISTISMPYHNKIITKYRLGN